MKIFSILEIQNKKIRKVRKIGLIVCLILGLISAMIMLFYMSTYTFFYYYIGYAILRLSIFYAVCIIACSRAFDLTIR